MLVGLTSGEWIGIILGIAGIVATIFIGWYFYWKTERQQINADEVANKVIALAEQKGKMFIDEGTLKKSLIDAIQRAEKLGESSKGTEVEKALEDLRRNGNTARLQTLLITDRETHKNEIKEHTEDIIKRNNEITAVAYLRGDIGIALEAVEDILKLRPNDLNALNRKGHIYELRGELTQAEEIYVKVLELAEDNKDDCWQAVALNGLGNIYQTRHKLDKAEEMYKKAIGLNEKLGRLEGMTVSYSNLGIVYEMRDELNKAEEVFLKALAIAEKTGDKEKMANIYGNLGNIHLLHGEFDKAENTYRKTMEIHKELGHQQGIARGYSNLGFVYRGRGELFKSEEMYNKALEIAEKIGDKELMAISYHNLGIVFVERGDLKSAKEYWVKALGLYEEIGVPQMVKDVQGRIDSAEGEKK